MKVYVFGNIDLEFDNKALKLKSTKDIEFIAIKPNQDLPFENGEDVVILDAVEGLNSVKVFGNDMLEKLKLSAKGSVHDYDLGFQLRYLKKLGKLGKVTIIGLPMHKKVNYSLIHSTLRKLVAQDIQGS